MWYFDRHLTLTAPNQMHRRHLLLAALAAVPLAVAAKLRLLTTRLTKGFVTKAGESRGGEHFTMRGVTLNTLDVKFSGADTNGDWVLFEQSGHTPKGGPPLHVHPLQDEFFYVIAGDYRFQVGEDFYELHPGDTIFLPRTVPHAFVQRSEVAKMLVSYQPAGKMEAFFRKTSQRTTPLSSAEMAQLFAEHEMRVVGPPLKAD